MPAKPPRDAITLLNSDVAQMSKVEKLKSESEGLFFVAGREKHSFASELDALSAGDAKTISNEAKEISKHFGIYRQQEREASGRKSGDYIFMLRLKLPAGGELSPDQWSALNTASERFADGALRMTTRQGIQFHYVYGRNLGGLVRFINQEYPDRGYRMETLGACGDINRNTMCSPIDDLDPELPLNSRDLAFEIARELAPKSSAYHQIFLTDDESRTLAPMSAEEPLYGKHYLPRKFKVGIAHPHDGSIELLTQDVGFLPIMSGAEPEEYDLYTGGGLGVTHNQPHTKQLLGLYLGRVPRKQVVDTVKAIAILQKENGERKDRRQARWKYTLRRLGPDLVKRMLGDRFGIEIKPAQPQPLPAIRFFHGWNREAGAEKRFFLGVPVLSGRLKDENGVRLRSAVQKIVAELELGVRITPNQDLLLCHIPAERREWVDQTLTEYGVPKAHDISSVRRLSFGCPAKPTCGLAMTDAENVIPDYIAALEKEGLGDVDLILRMAGCPNSCSRPPTAEIGIIGYGKNDHMIQVGGSREGTRIGKVLYERVPEEDMVRVLVGLYRALRDHNPEGLPPGDFLDRTSSDELRRLIGYPS